MLDTDQLRSFLAIVDTGSFTRAAERVNKTQSAVSMQVRRLEERLGGSARFRSRDAASASPATANG
jgi:DNA-binding transcriptional LysR family regulator